MKRLKIAAIFVALLLGGCTKQPEAPFKDVAAESGLVFQHVSGATGRFYLPEIMGSGVGLLDYDLDGDLDVYLVQGPAASGSRLFRNELVPSRTLKFKDITAQAGALYKGHGMGVASGDYDNDGDPDLYLTSFGENVLLRNEGNGTFRDVTRQAGVGEERWSTSAAFVDYDRDGKLDLFVGNYLNYTEAANKPCTAPTGEPDYCNPAIYQGLPSRLFHNEGNGAFRDATLETGIGFKLGKTLGVVCFDHDRDSWIDIYVANDGEANFFWRNLGGRFEEIALRAGAAYDANGKAQAGMGVDAADFDGNGTDDLFVTNLTNETNNLYRADGRGNFSDVILSSGMGPASRLFTGFGTRFFDYDHDGQLDLFVANGAVTRVEAQRGSSYPFRQPNQLFQNQGGRYQEMIKFQPEEVGRGAAFGDIDNDGDIDIVVTNNNGPVRLLLNQLGSQKPSLQVQLHGVRCNRQALGARVALLRDGRPRFWRRVQTDGSYLSASDSRVHLGPGSTEQRGVLVEWPDGTAEAWNSVSQVGFVTLRQGTGTQVSPQNDALAFFR